MFSKGFEKAILDFIKAAQFPPVFITLSVLGPAVMLTDLYKPLAAVVQPLLKTYPWAAFVIFVAWVFGVINMLCYFKSRLKGHRATQKESRVRDSLGEFILGLPPAEKRGLRVLVDQARAWDMDMFGEKSTDVFIPLDDPFARKLVGAGILKISPSSDGQNNPYYFDRNHLKLFLHNLWMLQGPALSKTEARMALKKSLYIP